MNRFNANDTGSVKVNVTNPALVVTSSSDAPVEVTDPAGNALLTDIEANTQLVADAVRVPDSSGAPGQMVIIGGYDPPDVHAAVVNLQGEVHVSTENLGGSIALGGGDSITGQVQRVTIASNDINAQAIRNATEAQVLGARDTNTGTYTVKSDLHRWAIDGTVDDLTTTRRAIVTSANVSQQYELFGPNTPGTQMYLSTELTQNDNSTTGQGAHQVRIFYMSQNGSGVEFEDVALTKTTTGWDIYGPTTATMNTVLFAEVWDTGSLDVNQGDILIHRDSGAGTGVPNQNFIHACIPALRGRSVNNNYAGPANSAPFLYSLSGYAEAPTDIHLEARARDSDEFSPGIGWVCDICRTWRVDGMFNLDLSFTRRFPMQCTFGLSAETVSAGPNYLSVTLNGYERVSA